MRAETFLALYLFFAWCQMLFLAKALVLPNFYHFGAISESDRVVPRNDDGSSGEVQISIPFPFFDRYHKSLYVSIANLM